MDKEEKPKNNEETGKEEVENSKNRSSVINPSKEKPTSNTPKHHSNNEEKKCCSNRGLFWINIMMLLAFIGVNYFLIDNSNKTIELARESTQIELKGYPVFDSVFFYKPAIGEELIICVHILNYGKTPVFFSNGEVKIHFDTEVWGGEIGDPPFNLGGEKSDFFFNIYSGWVLNKKDSSEIFGGDKHLYIHLWLVYKDIFNNADTLNGKYIYLPKRRKWANMYKDPDYYK